jgi:hypothetical protein
MKPKMKEEIKLTMWDEKEPPKYCQFCGAPLVRKVRLSEYHEPQTGLRIELIDLVCSRPSSWFSFKVHNEFTFKNGKQILPTVDFY